MKKAFLISLCVALVLVASAAELKEPVFRMTEPELLAVLKENGLNDKVTACQELGHVGTSAAVPALAALLTDATEPALFLAARHALENIPGAEAEAALKSALAVVADARRRGGIERSLRARTNPVPDGYAGASEKLTAFPPKTAVQKGDLSVAPALVEAALGTGPDAMLARRHLVGFPNDGVVDVMVGLLEGADAKKARLALDVLGDRRARRALPKLFAFAHTTKNGGLRMEAFKAFATLCDTEDLPQLLALLKRFPRAERLSGAVIRVASRAFEKDSTPVTVVKAEYGVFVEPRQVVDTLAAVRALVGGGSRALMASNHLAGQGGFPFDPAPGRHKELHLTYRLGDGPERSAIVQEGSEIKFTDYRLPEAPAEFSETRVAAAHLLWSFSVAKARLLSASSAASTLAGASSRSSLSTSTGSFSGLLRTVFSVLKNSPVADSARFSWPSFGVKCELAASFMMLVALVFMPLNAASRCLQTSILPCGSLTTGLMSEPSGTPGTDSKPSSRLPILCFMLYLAPDQLKSGQVQKHLTSAFLIASMRDRMSLLDFAIANRDCFPAGITAM